VDAAFSTNAPFIFQAQEGNNETVRLYWMARKERNNTCRGNGIKQRRQTGPGSAGELRCEQLFAPPFAGLNFAIATPASEHVELIFAGNRHCPMHRTFRRTGRFRQMAVNALALPLPLLVTVSAMDHRSRY